MSLKQFIVKRDKFEPDERNSRYTFPCSACRFVRIDVKEYPCRVCDYNISAMAE